MKAFLIRVAGIQDKDYKECVDVAVHALGKFGLF